MSDNWYAIALRHFVTRTGKAQKQTLSGVKKLP
jgi:hypothetical protein